MTYHDSNRLPVSRKLLTRIFSKIELSAEQFYNNSPCWNWIANINNHGYGMFSYGGSKRAAHTIMYRLVVGEIRSGLECDHLCRNTRCVNPAHIEPVSRRENVLRGVSGCAVNARKTQCEYGHELSGKNLVLPADGSRQCRKCRNRRQSESQKRQEARRKELPYDHPERVERRRYLADVAKRWRDKKRLKETAHNTGPK